MMNETHQKCLNRYFNSQKDFESGGLRPPYPLSRISLPQNYCSHHFNHKTWILRECGHAYKRIQLFIRAQNMYQKGLVSDYFINQKKNFSFWGSSFIL